MIIILVLAGKYGYDYYKSEINVTPQELENRKIDEYNFGELEKVKSSLDGLDKNSYKFDNIKEFNKQFNQNIKPIKNCYFLSERNGYFENKKGGGGYIFGFQLESKKYIEKYGIENYAYPKYDLPYDEVCFGLGEGGCSDFIYGKFHKTISNPCRD